MLTLALGLVLALAQEDALAEGQRALAERRFEEAAALATRALQAQPKSVEAYILRALAREALGQWAGGIEDWTRVLELEPRNADAYFQRGCLHFKACAFEASVRDFDRQIALKPERKNSHWQRGIACYYAGQWEEGQRQFEGYQKYDRNDVENALWRHMCMARRLGLEKARQDMLKIGDDRRVPMRQIYELFQGTLEPKDILAAVKGKPREAWFYAHLYVGIYHDLRGERRQALQHLERAAGEFRIDHFMGDVARVQRDLLARN